MRKISFSLVLVMLVLFSLGAVAQNDTTKKEGYEFTIVKELPATSVKNQYRSGTCWSYSSLSFLEAELLRIGKGEYDLSEMFIVWNTYKDKAEKYVRFHGNINFGGGGAFHDVLYVLDTYGMVPEEVYSSNVIDEKGPVHGELDGVAKAYVDQIIKNKNRKLNPVWLQGFEGILNAYLGTYPDTFVYNGTEYTPKSFAQELGLNSKDYVEIGSYMHHPYYEEFILEVPDNWMMDRIYNVQLDEMMEVIDNSIENGYTVAWGADVSEKGFSWKKGVAIVPDEELTDLTGTEKEKWEKLTPKERKASLYKFDGPVKEKVITPELRQEGFDAYETTDDHGMLITGIAKDQDGNKYYKIKNSWGTESHIYDGYFYASEAFVRLKTIDIMIHKDVVPRSLQKKLGF